MIPPATCAPIFAAVLWTAALLARGGGSDDCWEGDFNEAFCCGRRWGLTGNPACWNEEFTYLRCCGLDRFPRRLDLDAEWDKIQASRAPPQPSDEYDFVVVGAGSAGSVVAARLAAASGPDGRPWRVLLLESGPEVMTQAAAHPDEPPQDRALWREPLNVTWDAGGVTRTWSYSTGQGLGGTAAVNSMIYMRGSVSEYEAFGWSMEEVLEAYKTLEAPMEAPGFNASPSFHSSAAPSSSLQPDARGYHLSLVSATLEELPPLFRALVSAFEAAGVPFRVDPHGAASMHGVGGIWRSMGCAHPDCQPNRVSRFRYAKGRPRAATYSTLVAPLAASSRHRLHVVVDAAVERVLFDSDRKAIGVEVGLGGTGSQTWRRYTAAREVIIAAGTFNTPKLLTLSGVAEPRELERLGIPLVAASPEVGRHLHEHVGVSVVVGTSVSCPEGYHRQDGGRTSHLGNLDDFMGQLYVFFNSSGDEQGAAGPVDSEIMLLEGCLEGNLSLTFTIMQLQSRTRGRVVVQSRHPRASPALDYQPLSASGDVDALANAIRRLYTQVLSSRALDVFELTANPPWEVVADLGRLAAWIRLNLYFYAHPGGTCRVDLGVGGRGAVDSRFRVLGTSNLRVVDASAFPESPSAHSDGPVRLAGELASRFILQRWQGAGVDGRP